MSDETRVSADHGGESRHDGDALTSGNSVDSRSETLFTVGMTTTLHPYRIRTTDREVVIQAESIQHAHDLFTGKCWPPGVPAVPSPADRVVPNSGGLIEPTPEWRAWYHDEFLPRRAAYPVLAWAHGECMLGVAPMSEDGSHAVAIVAHGKVDLYCDCGWQHRTDNIDSARCLAESHVR